MAQVSLFPFALYRHTVVRLVGGETGHVQLVDAATVGSWAAP